VRRAVEQSGQTVIGASRFAVAIAIIGIGLSSVTLMIFGFIVVLRTIWDTFTEGHFTEEAAKHLAIAFIELTDLFLLSMVLQVVTIGLYQLYIDPGVTIPTWMRVKSLSDLKNQLINVIVVLLAVTFLATAVSWTSDRDILFYGAAIGFVILALAVFNLAYGAGKDDAKDDEPRDSAG
jgi:uncharacterized membrane protein YqhA